MTATEHDTEAPGAGEFVYRAIDPGHLSIRDAADGGSEPILEGRMMPYNEWTEVDSAIEGHFMERFAPGALQKTLRERGRQIRVLFEHGFDTLGKQPIATFDDFRDEDDGAYFEATLMRAVPDLILEGLRRGVYGSSVRFRALPGKWDRVRSPGKSEHNPDGIPEHTIREAFVREFSVVTFPAYAGATVGVRSLTDEVATRQLMTNPERLIEIIRNSEPQHSEPEPPPDPEPPEEPEPAEASRSTQPPDYLKDTEEDEWLL